MSFIPVTGGYRIQCDCCGKLRGGRNPEKRWALEVAILKAMQVPNTWGFWDKAGDDAHLCPECLAKEAGR